MLAIHELGADLEVTCTHHLFGCSGPNIVAEDPRAVWNPDTGLLEIWYVGIHRDTYPSCRIYRAELDCRYRVVSRQQLRYQPPRPETLTNAEEAFKAIRRDVGRIVQEKNWMPFRAVNPEGKPEWLCIYSHEPLQVLRLGQDGQMSLVTMGPTLHWGYGGIRGGAPPVWHDGRWWHFFHSSRIERPGPSQAKVYYVGCYTFGADGPLAITPEPILGGSVDCFTTPWDPGRISACFPCGAIVRDPQAGAPNFLISYGWLDAETRIAEIPITEIASRLRPL